MKLKNILFVIVALFVFTLVLNTIDNSKFQKNEYDRICHGLYDEKVLIDTCYLPIMQNTNTYEFAMKIEVAAIIVTLFFALSPNSYKHLLKILPRFKLD